MNPSMIDAIKSVLAFLAKLFARQPADSAPVAVEAPPPNQKTSRPVSEHATTKPTLTEQDFVDAAATLGCSVAVIKAVCQVEAPKGGFLPSGEPTILFERHQFSKRTGRQFDISHPRISSSKPGGYLGGQAEHARLAEAVALDRHAAMESASWGKFQIMGFNYASAGFDSLQSFVTAMYQGEGRQLEAFVAFIQHEGMAVFLRDRRWADFARRYNGVNFAINSYDTKLAAAYKALT